MFIVDLNCCFGHSFEGWYDSANDYYVKLNDHEISCPICDSKEVSRKPSATGLISKKAGFSPQQNFSKLAEISEHKANHIKALTDTPLTLEIQKAIAKVLKKIRQTHTDVGAQFAELALEMSRNERPLEPIIGQSTSEEETKLDKEGVPYFKIPIPDIEKN